MIADSKVHGANMGPTWVLSAPDGPLVGHMNLAIRDVTANANTIHSFVGYNVPTICIYAAGFLPTVHKTEILLRLWLKWESLTLAAVTIDRQGVHQLSNWAIRWKTDVINHFHLLSKPQWENDNYMYVVNLNDDSITLMAMMIMTRGEWIITWITIFKILEPNNKIENQNSGDNDTNRRLSSKVWWNQWCKGIT